MCVVGRARAKTHVIGDFCRSKSSREEKKRAKGRWHPDRVSRTISRGRKWAKMKYAIYLPMVYRGLVSPENDDNDRWHFHMSMIVLARYVMAQFFISLSRIHAITEKTRIQRKGIEFKQVDREDHWDDYILLQYIVMSMVHFCPGLGFKNFPLFEKKGMWQLLLLHVGPTEYLYYWLHRLLHHHALYKRVSLAPSREFRDRAHHWERASVYGTHNVYRKLCNSVIRDVDV